MTALTLGDASQTATVTEEYTISPASVSFVDGELTKQVTINLVEDDVVEDTEFLLVILDEITAPDPAMKVSLDTDRSTSKIYIEDRSCKLNLAPVHFIRLITTNLNCFLTQVPSMFSSLNFTSSGEDFRRFSRFCNKSSKAFVVTVVESR